MSSQLGRRFRKLRGHVLQLGQNLFVMPGCAAGSVRLGKVEKYCHIAAGSFTALLITDELYASSRLLDREVR